MALTRWTWGAVVLGLVLVLPLAGLFWRGGVAREVGGWRLLPKPSPATRWEQPSFLKPCWRSSDCAPPLACFHDRVEDRQVCIDSDCVTDSECPSGTVCRFIPVGDGTRQAIGLCSFVGVLGEGVACERLSRRDEGACERGLVCADWCARRCGLWPFDACPEGYFCAEDEPNGRVCLPTCEGRACPEGEACLRQERAGVSVCARVHGADCQREPCAAGQRCQLDMSPARPGEAWMTCVTPCTGEGSTQKGCPEHLTCLFGTCREYCDLSVSGACGPDFSCIEMSGDWGACVWTPEPLKREGIP